VVSIGRFLAPSSPSKVTFPRLSVESGGTNRITVPAKPQSTVAEAFKVAGETVGEVLSPPETSAPKDFRAASIRLLSLETKAPAKRVGSSAIAARTSSRLVSDFEPGRGTTEASERGAEGAGHWEYVESVICY
jgi:hypothetical protein